MVLDDMNARDQFLFHLDWLLSLEARYHHILQSGLVHVALNPADVHGLTYDAGDAAHKLGEVMTCLQQAFRSTDLVMREGMSFWILTPFTQLDPVVEKVKTVISTAPKNGLEIAQSNVKIYLLRDHMSDTAAESKSAEAFLDYLRSNPAPIAHKPV
jgi:hypothetical protein